jgi:hypothetical protein
MSKSQKLSKFVIFCVAKITMNFGLKLCMIVEYIITYSQIFFHNFLKLRNTDFDFVCKTSYM